MLVPGCGTSASPLGLRLVVPPNSLVKPLIVLFPPSTLGGKFEEIYGVHIVSE